MKFFLWQYYLQMDGRGAYEFQKIEPDTQQFGSWAVDDETLKR